MKHNKYIAFLILIFCVVVLTSVQKKNFTDDSDKFTKVKDKISNVTSEGKEQLSTFLKSGLQIFGYKDPEEKASLHKVSLIRVVDGDTLVVSDKKNGEYKVRLIGIDTPESVHADESKNNVFGDMASEHVKELLKNTEVLYLEYDKEKEDKYGRTLSYVWGIKDADTENMEKNMLNAAILYDGYAVSKRYKPNVKYANYFDDVTAEAKKEERGLWAEKGIDSIWE